MTPFALHLLRHGAPEIPGRMLGRTDVASTPEGIAACVEQARDLGIATLIASDLSRARAAGEAIARHAHVPLQIDPRWRELDFGAWDGLPSSAIDPATLGRFWDDPDMHPPPGGERWSSLVARVAAAIGGLDTATTLVVTHGGAIRAALHWLCGFEQRQLWAFDLPYGAMLSLRLWPGERPSAQMVGLYP